LILTIPAGVFIYVWQGDLSLAFVVASALLSAVVIGSSLGYVVPYALMRVGLDQAAGADPIIMTIIDVTGISIYFLLATLFYL
jgi:magnesium transporter